MNVERILVVDDEPQIRRVLRATLTDQGYETLDAGSGDDALIMIRENHFGLVLLDMNMPGMGGLEACRSIRAKSKAAIIMLTVHNLEVEKVAALDSGADDYVTKPFIMAELLARVRSALRRVHAAPERGGPGSVHLENLEINLATRRLIVSGREVRLTPRQFDLLNFFLSNPNVPIPHKRLLQGVWGPDYGDQVEYLRVFVNQLRKKLEPDPSKPRYLLTEPWVGYRFVLSKKS
jgi:two-component system, OmpR family, KDP operon response regulator KdpE